MKAYKLKPIKWITEQVGIDVVHHIAKSPTHTYRIAYSATEKCYGVWFYNLHTGNSDVKYLPTEQDCKEWVENTHIPAKLHDWFDEV